MNSTLGNLIGGLATAYVMKKRYDAANQSRQPAQQPATPSPTEDSIFDKGVTWLKNQFSPGRPTDPAEFAAMDGGSTPGPSRPPSALGSNDSASTWDRLKAGNIDQVGSDAYNRWGDGARIQADQTNAGAQAAADAAQNQSQTPDPSSQTDAGGTDPAQFADMDTMSPDEQFAAGWNQN